MGVKTLTLFDGLVPGAQYMPGGPVVFSSGTVTTSVTDLGFITSATQLISNFAPFTFQDSGGQTYTFPCASVTLYGSLDSQTYNLIQIGSLGLISEPSTLPPSPTSFVTGLGMFRYCYAVLTSVDYYNFAVPLPFPKFIQGGGHANLTLYYMKDTGLLASN